jgi:hypothetical protein
MGDDSGLSSLNDLFKRAYAHRIRGMFRQDEELPLKWINDTKLARKVLKKEHIVHEKEGRILILDGTEVERDLIVNRKKCILCSPKLLETCYEMTDSDQYRGFAVYSSIYIPEDQIKINEENYWEIIYLSKDQIVRYETK